MTDLFFARYFNFEPSKPETWPTEAFVVFRIIHHKFGYEVLRQTMNEYAEQLWQRSKL